MAALVLVIDCVLFSFRERTGHRQMLMNRWSLDLIENRLVKGSASFLHPCFPYPLSPYSPLLMYGFG